VSQLSETKVAGLTTKGKKTRQKILDTAEQIFGEKGYFETSVAEITLTAGIAQGTFYNYFPTKKAVFEELIKQLSSNFRYEIKVAMEKEQSFEAKQRAGYQAFFEWLISHRNLYSIIQQSVLVDQALYRWYYDKIATGFIKSIELAIDNKECKPLNSETVAYCLMGIGQFIGMRWIYWDDKSVPDTVFDEAMELIFKGLNHTLEG
jgi:AcrR family transcriptional regulator